MGQRRLEAPHCDAGARNAQTLQMLQSFEPYQSRVGDGRKIQIEVGEVRHSGKARQAGVSSLCAFQLKPFKVRESFEVCQPGVCNHGPIETKSLELRQLANMRQAGVAYLGVLEVERLKVRKPVPCSASPGRASWPALDR